MGGWKTKLVVLVVVYLAGFATAIYYFAPDSQKAMKQSAGKSYTYSSEKAGELSKTFSSKMHEYMADAKAAAEKASTYVKTKFEETKS